MTSGNSETRVGEIGMALLWGLLLGFLISIFFQPQLFPELTPVFLPLILHLYLIQKIYLPGVKIRWDRIAFFLYLVFAIVLATQLSLRDNIALLLYFTALVVLLQIARNFFRRNDAAILACKEQIRDLLRCTAEAEKDTKFYLARVKEMRFQIEERKKLSVFTKEIGRLLDPEAVKQKLLHKICSIFPEEKVSFEPLGSGNDPVTQWVSERKIPVLIRDFSEDSRFFPNPLPHTGTETVSLMAVPLIVGKNLLGMIRIDSKISNRFLDTDLQQLELYSNIASLAFENSQLYLRVNALATQDGLTGLSTHKLFQEKLIEEILRSARYHKPLSLVMLDIDHFKMLNDSFGHLAGDEVLKKVAQVIQSHCREVDFPARYGGEEFAVILPETTLEEAFEFGEKLRRKISQQTIGSFGQNLKITVSGGCAAFPREAQIPSQLIRKADERLYRAKRLGRNRLVMD